MEVKKSKKARLERFTSTFFLIGLVVSLFVVLLAFEFKSERVIAKLDIGSSTSIWDDPYIPPTKRPEPKPMKVNVITTKVEIVDNDVVTEEVISVEDLSEDLSWEPDFENEDEIEVEIVVPFPEIQPEFPGGYEALMKFLSENISYPQTSIEFREEGTVHIQFTVSSLGIVKDVKVLRGVSPALDEEAMRVVMLMPKWIPAQQGIRKVATYFRIPIKFTLSN